MDSSKQRLLVIIGVGAVLVALALWYAKSARADQAQGQIANAQSQSQSGSLSASSSTALGGTSVANAAGGHASGGDASNRGNNQLIQFNSEAVDLGEAVPSMVAPGLTTTLSGTCFGSTSGSLVVAGFGGSLGKTWEDLRCQRRLDSNQLTAMGLQALAVEVMCSGDEILAADAKMETPVCSVNIAAANAPAAADDAPAVSSHFVWDNLPMASIDVEQEKARVTLSSGRR